MTIKIDRNKIMIHLNNFNLQTLFVDGLGWDRFDDDATINIREHTFFLRAIAIKRDMIAYQYISDSSDDFPNHSMRKKIERELCSSIREHLIVFTTHDLCYQYWHWTEGEDGQHKRSLSLFYNRDEPTEDFIRRLEHLAFVQAEKCDPIVSDLFDHVPELFDLDKATKRFYEQFRVEHKLFDNSIKGIELSDERQWYASLMLNRLMFIYFVQKKGFLNSDVEYLRNHLRRFQVTREENRSSSFYHQFLLRLFHEGLSKPEINRTNETVEILGNIPYLNGGIFETYNMERQENKIHIPDVAFERIFDFFDSYQWHLNNQSILDEKEINPDILGYIFEKYINQKQMGAYYTKEDITRYISQSTILANLFENVQNKNPDILKPGEGAWLLLKENPNRYFYNSVRHGITHNIQGQCDFEKQLELPPDIAEGLKDVSKRDKWNNIATAEYGLPTETWREHIARRQHYNHVHEMLTRGEIKSINDFVTYNLNIMKFVQDVIAETKTPKIVQDFWSAIYNIKVLDPTCGSGAFLFATINVLESIYFVCLDTMKGLLGDMKRTGPNHHGLEINQFESTLASISKHNNERYYVLKNIIIRNLYGVDIMKEAVEICKLRLFLKLVAQLTNFDQIEPLPDIDFNIRVGNSVVGLTSQEQIMNLLSKDMFHMKCVLPNLIKRTDEAYKIFCNYRSIQAGHIIQKTDTREKKAELLDKLSNLRSELDSYLALEYHIDVNRKERYDNWRETHQPFHWYVEFHEIMSSGGFDIVIGNPPYITSNDIRHNYNVKDMQCSECPDIYAWILERTLNLLRKNGRTGMIVPLSVGFSKDFNICRNLFYENYSYNWFSSFGRIPSALFSSDVRVRNTIHIGLKGVSGHCNYTTRLHRWYEAARPYLFEQIRYTAFEPDLWEARVPKLNSNKIGVIFEKQILSSSYRLSSQLSRMPTKYYLYFKKTAYNWLNFCRHLPPCYDKQGKRIKQTKFGKIYFHDQESQELTMMLANGKIMLAYWFMIADDFDVTHWNFTQFPIDYRKISQHHRKQLLEMSLELEQAMNKNVQFKINAEKKIGNYNLAKCREITDRSDLIFLDALGILDVWEEIELYCTQVVRTDFGDG